MSRTWMVYSLVTLVLWGVYGFLYKLASERFGPHLSTPQLGGLFMAQVVSSLLVNVALVGGFRIFSMQPEYDTRASLYVSFGNCAAVIGSLAIIAAMARGKASLVVMLTALYPIVTIILSFVLLRERLTIPQWAGVVLAFVSIFLMAQGK